MNKSFEKKSIEVLVENKLKNQDKLFGRNSYLSSVIFKGSKDIIGKMYLHDGKFHINIDDNDGSENLKKRVFNGPVNIEKLHLTLLDEYGNKIYLNNMDFSFSLEFEILYEKYQNNYTR